MAQQNNPHQGTEITATSGVTFIYYNVRMTWPAAARFCARHHSKLAVIMNAEDNALLADVITASNTEARGTWLGATSLDTTSPMFNDPSVPAHRLPGRNRQASTDDNNWYWYPEDGLGSLGSRRAAGDYVNWSRNEPNNGGNPSRPRPSRPPRRRRPRRRRRRPRRRRPRRRRRR